MAINAIARRLALDRKTVRQCARAYSPELLIGPNPGGGRRLIGPFPDQVPQLSAIAGAMLGRLDPDPAMAELYERYDSNRPSNATHCSS